MPEPQSTSARKRRLALCLEYPIDLQGGVSALCRALAIALSPHYEIVLVSPDSADEIRRCSIAAHVASHVRWNPAGALRAASVELAAALVKERVDLAHFHLGGPFGWGNRFPGRAPVLHVARAGIPCCNTVHLVVSLLDGFCGPQRPLAFKLAMLPLSWIARLQTVFAARREIVVSRWGRERLAKWYFPAAGRFAAIYHSRVSEHEVTGGGERTKTILNVGHLAERKGQMLLLRAFARIANAHPEWRLEFVGGATHPEFEEEMRRFVAAQQLHERVTIFGARPDSLAFMARAEIFVQPSLFEGLPLALQEAMLSGCACIGSDIPGNDELITHGETGMLARKNDVPALAEALDRMIRDESLRKTFQQRARASVLDKQMSLERMAAEHLALYDEVLRESSRRNV